jgi:hypothetical protein
MENISQAQSNSSSAPVTNAEAVIKHFQADLASGKHWYLAVLEAIGLWTDEREDVQEHHYRYLIEGEAFDWLLLVERLCDTVDGSIPENEKFDLVLHGKPPLALSSEEFKNLIGASKYHQYLNYYYGITVEEALVQAVREEVRKEKRSNGLSYKRVKEEDEVFTRVYDLTQTDLLKQFRKEKHYHLLGNSSISEMKEFSYWCFKYRVKTCEKARVASDTNKGLEWLRKHGSRL